MASLEAIRDAIKATIENNVDPLSGYDTVPDVVNVPAFVVVPETANFDVSMARGTDTWNFKLFVLVSTANMDTGQDTLDSFVSGGGINSIRQAVFVNKDLGLTDTNAHVTGMSDYGAQFPIASIEHIGAVLGLQVHTRGTE